MPELRPKVAVSLVEVGATPPVQLAGLLQSRSLEPPQLTEAARTEKSVAKSAISDHSATQRVSQGEMRNTCCGPCSCQASTTSEPTAAFRKCAARDSARARGRSDRGVKRRMREEKCRFFKKFTPRLLSLTELFGVDAISARIPPPQENFRRRPLPSRALRPPCQGGTKHPIHQRVAVLAKHSQAACEAQRKRLPVVLDWDGKAGLFGGGS